VNNVAYYTRDFCKKFRFNNSGILYSHNGNEKMGELIKIEIKDQKAILQVETNSKIIEIAPEMVLGRAIVIEFVNNMSQKLLCKPLTVFNDIIK